MSKRRLTDKFIKLDTILADAKFSKWCIVDTENVFKFKGQAFTIDQSVEQYRVLNKPQRDENGNWNEWTNDAKMDKVLCVGFADGVRYFDQSVEEIDSEFIKQV